MGYEAYNWTHNSESVKSGISTSSTDLQDNGGLGIQKFSILLQGNKTTNLISCNSTDWLPNSVSLRVVRFAANM